MEQFTEGESIREEIKNKLRQNFDGKIVRKDLTKKIKEGANVPVYVLEFLLGQYCCPDDESVIEKGVQNVKIGITNATVSQYCSGRAQPTLATLSKLCKFLDCSADDILNVK